MSQVARNILASPRAAGLALLLGCTVAACQTAPASLPGRAAASSTVPAPAPAPSESSAPVTRPRAPHPVWIVDDGWVILRRDGVPEGVGEPEILVRSGVVRGVRRAVDPAVLSAIESGLVGARLETFHPGGGACSATVRAVYLGARAYGTFDTTPLLERVAKTDPSARGRDPMLRDGIARILAESGGRYDLVAEIEPSPTCVATGGWAAPAGSPQPALAELVEPDDALAATSVARLRALPVFDAIDAYYRTAKKPSEPEHWWALPEYDEGATVATAPDGRRVVAVRASVCRGYADFTMNLEVFFDVGDGGELRVREPAEPSEARWPAAVSDLDDDGDLDVVTIDGFLLAEGARLGPQWFTRGPIYTCPGDGAAGARFLAWRGARGPRP